MASGRNMDSEKIILHVDMDAFFASVEQKADPSLRGRPVGVCSRGTSRTVIAACSYEAKRMSVASGMPVKKAQSLCAELVLVEGNMSKYANISAGIMEILGCYSDLLEAFSIDEAFLDITRTHHLFDGPENTAKKIKNRIYAEYGLSCSIGIGPSKLLAKLATGMGKPDGLTLLSDPESVLEDLPVEKLCGIGARTSARLADMGIRTCGELALAPVQNLREAFGIYGDILSMMANGTYDDPVCPSEKVKSAGHSITLPEDTADVEKLLDVLLMLSEKVSARIRDGGYKGRVVSLTIRYLDFKTFTFNRTGSFTDNGYRIFIECKKLFLTRFSGRPVRLLGVRVSGLRKEPAQLYLFEYEDKESRIEETLDAIRQKMGSSAIGRGWMLGKKTDHGKSGR